MTGYEVNILRNIREDRKRYSSLLQIESKKQQPNTSYKCMRTALLADEEKKKAKKLTRKKTTAIV